MQGTIILGLIQGLTEFLPISSSGHLVLAQSVLGLTNLDPAFNVFVQGGTVLSVLLYFRSFYKKLTLKYLGLLILGTAPAAIAGLLLKDKIDMIFSSMIGAAIGFFATTIVVWLSRYAKSTLEEYNAPRAFITGLAQACAILPGLTRSGTTITTSLLLGISPVSAFNFSFLLSIPVIAGASILGARSIVWEPSLVPSYLAGFFVACLSGYLSLTILARLMKKGHFHRFAPYTFALGLLTLVLALN